MADNQTTTDVPTAPQGDAAAAASNEGSLYPELPSHSNDAQDLEQPVSSPASTGRPLSVRSDLVWADDSDVSRCNFCADEFGVVTRRHHCRVCGHVFCGKCLHKTVVDNAQQLVCFPCLRAADKAANIRPNPKSRDFDTFTSEDSKRQVGPLKSVHVICNPFSGGKRGLQLLGRVIPQLQKAGIECVVLMTERAGHAGEMVNTMTLKDAVVVLGGDGTCHEVVNGMLGREDGKTVPIAMVPAGSGNTFAWDLGIRSVDQACKAIIAGTARVVDLQVMTREVATFPKAETANTIKPETDQPTTEETTTPTTTTETAPTTETSANATENTATHIATKSVVSPADSETADKPKLERIYSVNIVGWGVPSNNLRIANRLRVLGKAQYNIAAMKQIATKENHPVRIMLDNGVVREGDFMLVQSQNNVLMGSLSPFCPKAKCDDGLLDVILIPKQGVRSAAGIFRACETASHINGEGLEYFQVKSYSVQPLPDSDLVGENATNVDGELVGWAPYTVSCAPRAITMIAAK